MRRATRREGGDLAGVERVLHGPLSGLAMEPVDVGLELFDIDAPHAPAPDLDGRKLPGSHDRIDLGDADTEVGGDVFESEEARLDPGAVGLLSS